MAADRIRYTAKPFTIAVLSVLALEYAARFLPMNPLWATGAVRLIDIAVISALAWIFGKDALLAGIIPPDITRGLKRGALWSAGFGAVAALAGIVLHFAGVDPVALIHVGLPNQGARLALFVVIAGLVGPIAEELFFRGVVYGFLRRWGILAAVIGSTLLFIWAHHLQGGIPVPQAVGGLVFAISYETEKNLWVPVVIHVTGNLALFTLPLIF